MSKEELLRKMDEAAQRDIERRHPDSPCFTCQFYRELQLIDHSWVFKLPNEPKFAHRNTLHAWCIIEVLDRFPQPLYAGESCSHCESRDIPIKLTHNHIKMLHPSRTMFSKAKKKEKS